MRKILGYFKGVGSEIKRIKWPKKEQLVPAIVVVIIITVFAGIFLSIEDLAASTLIQQLRDAFESLRG